MLQSCLTDNCVTTQGCCRITTEFMQHASFRTYNSIMVICLLSPVSQFTAAISCYLVLTNAKCSVQSKVGWFLLLKFAKIIDDTAFNSPIETILSWQVAFTLHTMLFSEQHSYACISWPVVWAYVIWQVQLFEVTVQPCFSLVFPAYIYCLKYS